MTQEQDTAMLDQPEPTEHIGPDCQYGKCKACDGRALDEATDQIVDCDCPCHTEES
jgi:hypothetical protein